MRRAKPRDLVVGLDVGTTKICAVITEPGPLGVLSVIGVGTAPSSQDTAAGKVGVKAAPLTSLR